MGARCSNSKSTEVDDQFTPVQSTTTTPSACNNASLHSTLGTSHTVSSVNVKLTDTPITQTNGHHSTSVATPSSMTHHASNQHLTDSIKSTTSHSSKRREDTNNTNNKKQTDVLNLAEASSGLAVLSIVGKSIRLPSVPNAAGEKTQKMDTWRITEVLGRGSTGAVYSAKNSEGFSAAIKVIAVDETASTDVSKRSVQRELDAIQQLPNHPNLVTQFGATKEKSCWCLVTELCRCGDLRRMYKRKGKAPTDLASLLVRDVLLGLNCLHSNMIMHRDLKGVNVFLDSSGLAKIGDFGCSAVLQGTSRATSIGTPHWMAPEVLRHQKYSFPADIWSLGCLTLELMTAEVPLRNIAPHISALYTYLTSSFVFDDAVPKKEVPDDDARAFIRDCLQLAPESRPTATLLLDYAFIKRANNFTPEYVAELRSGLCKPEKDVKK